MNRLFIEIRIEFHSLDNLARNAFEPDTAPNSACGGVPNAFGIPKLFSARIYIVINVIDNVNDDFVFAGF